MLVLDPYRIRLARGVLEVRPGGGAGSAWRYVSRFLPWRDGATRPTISFQSLLTLSCIRMGGCKASWALKNNCPSEDVVMNWNRSQTRSGSFLLAALMAYIPLPMKFVLPAGK